MSIDLLPQILNEIKAINKSQQETKEFQDEMRGFQREMREFQGEMREFQGEVNTRLTSIEESQRRTEDKLDIVYDQTSNLTEVQTTLKHELNSLSKEVYFLSHKEVENEKEVITIKRHLELIK